MKKLLVFLFMIFIFIGCEIDNEKNYDIDYKIYVEVETSTESYKTVEFYDSKKSDWKFEKTAKELKVYAVEKLENLDDSFFIEIESDQIANINIKITKKEIVIHEKTFTDIMYLTVEIFRTGIVKK